MLREKIENENLKNAVADLKEKSSTDVTGINNNTAKENELNDNQKSAESSSTANFNENSRNNQQPVDLPKSVNLIQGRELQLVRRLLVREKEEQQQQQRYKCFGNALPLPSIRDLRGGAASLLGSYSGTGDGIAVGRLRRAKIESQMNKLENRTFGLPSGFGMHKRLNKINLSVSEKI
ncbi:hypothetical protein HDU92_001021 [Lobulomyces angularis]|nr:hypothetical protein HDU92_001021 [Lobulomyces angularis]